MAPDQMCEIKFLQMRFFSIILTSLHSLSLLFYEISTAILKFLHLFFALPP